jgi:uncharacterized membrane protein
MKVIKVFHFLFLFLWLGSLALMPALIREKFSGCYRFYKKYELPCMIFAILTGISLLVMNPTKLQQGFFHMKLTGAFALIACDIWIGRQAKFFAQNGTVKSQRALWIAQVFIFFFLVFTLTAIIAWQK